MKLELVRVEPDPEDEIKIEEKENVVLVSPKLEKNVEPSKLEVTPESKTVDSTEDIYEFKEPEPFEFEVRNKRDTSGEKDKVKKRMFEEDPKSPKKKQKMVVSSLIKEVKPEMDSDSRKRTKKLFSKRVDDITESLPTHKSSQSMSSTTCEEAFDKLCESPSFNQAKSTPVIEETSKITNGIDRSNLRRTNSACIKYITGTGTTDCSSSIVGIQDGSRTILSREISLPLLSVPRRKSNLCLLQDIRGQALLCCEGKSRIYTAGQTTALPMRNCMSLCLATID